MPKKTTKSAVASSDEQEESVHALLRYDDEKPAVYSNQVELAATPFDICLIFREVRLLQNGPPLSTEQVRVYVSPQHAKSIHTLLGKKIEYYEERWGKIPSVD